MNSVDFISSFQLGMNVEEENEVMLPQRHLLLLNNLLLCFLPHLVKLLSHSCHGKCLPVASGKDLILDILESSLNAVLWLYCFSQIHRDARPT